MIERQFPKSRGDGQLTLLLNQLVALPPDALLERFAVEVARFPDVHDFALARRAGTAGRRAQEFVVTAWTGHSPARNIRRLVDLHLSEDFSADDALHAELINPPAGHLFDAIHPHPRDPSALTSPDDSNIPVILMRRDRKILIGALVFACGMPLPEFMASRHEEFAFLTSLTHITLLLLENHLLDEERRGSLARKEAIHAANRAFQNDCRTVRDLVHEATARAAALVAADRVAFYAHSRRTRQFIREHTATPGGRDAAPDGPERVFLEEGDLYRGALASGAAVELAAADSDFAGLAAGEPARPDASPALIPVATGGTLAGAFAVSFHDPARRLDPGERSALRLLADQAAHALNHLRQVAADARRIQQHEALLTLNGELLRSLFRDVPLDALLARLADQTLTLGLHADPETAPARPLKAGLLEERDGSYRPVPSDSPGGRSLPESLALPAAPLEAALARRDEAPFLAADDPDAAALAAAPGAPGLPFPVAFARHTAADGAKRLFVVAGGDATDPLFHTVTALARNAVEGARLRREAAEKERIEGQLELARAVQERLLPGRSPDTLPLEAAGFWLPTRMVGGDYYDVLALADGGAALLIADVSGKGPAAALVMVMMRTLARTHAARFVCPGEFLAYLNEELAGELDLYTFITACCVRVDAAGNAAFAGAGHNPAFVFRAATGAVEPLASPQPPLGIARGERYEVAEFTLGPRDRLLCYTDGVTEAEDERGAFYGEERLRETFSAAATAADAAGTLDAIKADLFERHCRTTPDAARLRDDATLVVAALRPAPETEPHRP